MKKYSAEDFDNECWVCGKDETFNVCVECGCNVFMHENSHNKNGTDGIMQYIKDTNLEKFNIMVELSEKEQK